MQALGRHGQVAAIAHRHRRPALGPAQQRPQARAAAGVQQLEQQRQQVDLAAVHVHPELELEPVGVLFLRLLEIRVPGLAGHHPALVALGDLHPPAPRAQPRHRLRREGAQRVHVVRHVDHVVGLIPDEAGVGVQLAELHRAEALQHLPGAGLPHPIPRPGGLPLAASDEIPGIARRYPHTPIVEAQAEHRGLHLLIVGAHAPALIDEDRLAHELQAGDEGGGARACIRGGVMGLGGRERRVPHRGRIMDEAGSVSSSERIHGIGPRVGLRPTRG